MILYGASGHGKVVLSALDGIVSFFFDDNDLIDTWMGLEVKKYSFRIRPNEEIAVTIGDNRIRKSIVQRLKHPFGIVKASSSQVDQTVLIGVGSQILQRSLIQSSVQVGEHCIINSMASIDHDCSIGNFVHIAPNATLCGNISIGTGTLIGAGSVVIPNINIGNWSVIAAGSVVTRNIPDRALAAGNPARIIKYYERT